MDAARADAKLFEISSRIERLPITSWQVGLLFFVGVALFFDAFDALAIAFALPALVGPWHLRPQQVGVLISAGYVGQLFGALFFGWVADRIGRLRTLILATLFFAGLSILCAVSWSYTSLLVFRMLQGLGLGGEMPVAASYITEMTKAKRRGIFFLSYQMVFPVGLMLGSFLGYWVVSDLGWRWLFLLGGSPIILTAFLPWILPESPRWLASAGRIEEAERIMARIEEKVKKAFKADLPEWKSASLPPPTGSRPEFGDLFRGMYRRRTIVSWLIFFSAYLTTYGVNTWLPTIYKTVYKVPTDKAMFYSVIVFVVGFVSSLGCCLLIDKVGRRTWIGGALCIGGPLLVILWWLGATTAVQVLVWTSLAYVFISSVSIASVLYSQEIYPTRMRAMGSSVGTGWLRIAAIVGPVVVGAVIAHSSLSWAFLFFGATGLFGGLVTIFFGTETKGRVLEDISP